MARLFRIRWFMDFLLTALLACAALGLIVSPKETAAAAREGFALCVDVILPSLFPFFVISALTIELGLTRRPGALLEPVMRPLFRLSGPCSAAVVLGFLGGYPVGAKTAISLYESGLCDREEAERLLAFCNNSGPAFILGAVGTGILGSSAAGWLLYLTHTAASLTVGVLFRFYKRKDKRGAPRAAETGAGPRAPGRRPVRLSEAFTRSVKSSFSSVFYISAFVIFFTVTVRLLFLSGLLPGAAQGLGGLLGVSACTVEQWLTGCIELTGGLWSLRGDATEFLAGKMAMAAFMLGWAGLSVHCQVLSFIGGSGLSARAYIAGKLLHGLISAAYTALVMSVSGLSVPVSGVIAEQVEGLAGMRFTSTLLMTLGIGAGVFLAFLLGAAPGWRRRGRRVSTFDAFPHTIKMRKP
ncbi:MAG: sporulation protein [Oscillospiraceae bacterium]|nr:sporulation protein [Oscillospiraceae bacterium]